MNVTSHQGDTLDTLCWRHLGTTQPVEATLQLNPGLAALGPTLPQGATVALPDIEQNTRQPKQTIQLWD